MVMNYLTDAPGFHTVLDFWFGAPGGVDYGKSRAAWFKKSDTFDASIRERFSGVYRDACEHRLAHWRESPLSLLALIVVWDQFPRNMYRDSREAFASDRLARDAARRMLDQRWDERLNAVERSFVYLPFEHAEDLETQRLAVACFRRLGNAGLLEWAQKHCDIIERFGRFPHRNALLGRASTPEEVEFLKQPGSRF